MRRVRGAGALALAVCAALLLGIVLRLTLPAMPAWLDEAWTGAVIANDSFGETLRRALNDPNAPFYFVVVHGWSALFGLSNDALRFPSLLFGVLAPLLALIPIKGVPRQANYVWSICLTLWFPAIYYSQEARCYTLLLFLVTACTIAYVRLLQQPDTRRAATWAGLGALCVLTHYHAFILLGLQGLAYLAAHRVRALRTWPAAILFAPALAWSAVHLPHVAKFADPKFAWYAQLTITDIPAVILFVLGGFHALVGLIGIAMLALVLGAARPESAAETPQDGPLPRAVGVAVATAAIGAAIVVVAALFSTSFTTRYLIVFMPGLMLGFAVAVARLGRRSAAIPVALAVVLAVAAVIRAGELRGGGPLKTYNFQAASDALMAAGVRNLVFFWDNPSNPLFAPDQRAALGGFFFKRADYAAAVKSIDVPPGQDPHPQLLAAANAHPGSAILWLYDLGVRGTAAIAYPPALDRHDTAWQCRQFGRADMGIGVLACVRG
jgi:uncharacterized membrane protein